MSRLPVRGCFRLELVSISPLSHFADFYLIGSPLDPVPSSPLFFFIIANATYSSSVKGRLSRIKEIVSLYTVLVSERIQTKAVKELDARMTKYMTL